MYSYVRAVKTCSAVFGDLRESSTELTSFLANDPSKQITLNTAPNHHTANIFIIFCLLLLLTFGHCGAQP